MGFQQSRFPLFGCSDSTRTKERTHTVPNIFRWHHFHCAALHFVVMTRNVEATSLCIFLWTSDFKVTDCVVQKIWVSQMARSISIAVVFSFYQDLFSDGTFLQRNKALSYGFVWSLRSVALQDRQRVFSPLGDTSHTNLKTCSDQPTFWHWKFLVCRLCDLFWEVDK